MSQSQGGREAVCVRANRGAAKVFGRRSRSGANEIRAEQTDINTSPKRHAQTDRHAQTPAQTLGGNFFLQKTKGKGIKSAEDGKSGWKGKWKGKEDTMSPPFPTSTAALSRLNVMRVA